MTLVIVHGIYIAEAYRLDKSYNHLKCNLVRSAHSLVAAISITAFSEGEPFTPVADPRGGGGWRNRCAPLKLDQLCFFIQFFIRMLKNKAQIARKSIKTTPEGPGPASRALKRALDPCRK